MGRQLSEMKAMKTARVYHKCYFCGGKVSEQKITVDYRWGDKLVTIIKNVPAGVCESVGSNTSKPPLLRQWSGRLAPEKAERDPEGPSPRTKGGIGLLISYGSFGGSTRYVF